MNRKLVTGLITVLGLLLTLFSPMIMGLLAVATWIFLVLKVQKKNTLVFQDLVQPALAERLLKKMKVLLIVGGCAFLVFIAGAFLHTHNLTKFEMSPSFLLTLVSLWVFIFSTFGSLLILLKGQQKIA